MELSSQFLSATIVIPDEVIGNIASEIKKSVSEYQLAVFNGNTPTKSIDDVIRDTIRKHLSADTSSASTKTTIISGTSASVSPDVQPSSVTSKKVDEFLTSEETTEQPKNEFPFDLDKVVNFIMESIRLVELGESCDEVSEILNGDVISETNNLVLVSLKNTKHGIVVNMHDTPQVVALHPVKWSGLVRPQKVHDELLTAFSGVYSTGDSTTPLSGKHRVSKRPSGYSQGTYKRVKRGSCQMRMRCHRNSDQLAPMVIDPEIGEYLYENGFTHVGLTCTVKNTNGDYKTNEQNLNLVFTKEAIPTRAPRLSMTISRLHPYGQNKAAGKTSTYCLGSDTFNRSILNHFNQTCKGLEERVYEIRQTGPEKSGKIGFEITAVTA